MRIFLLSAFLIISIAAAAQSKKKPAHYRVIKTILTDVNGDSKTDTIVISSSLKTEMFFNRISVSLAGFKKQTFRAKDSWTVVDKEFLDSNKNSVNTELLFFKKTQKHAVILLFGELDGAGYRGEFSIINIENDTAKMVFDHYNDNVFVEGPEKLIDLEKNGRLCFIYRQIGELFRQEKSGDIGTYHPYYVYPVLNKCALDSTLTKEYNNKFYVFAGFNYSEKIEILYPYNKKRKPRIWKE